MSDRPIQVGDLVMVVKPSACRGGNNGIGHIFRVQYIGRWDEYGNCAYCKQANCAPNGFYADDGDGAWPLSRLKLIDPPALRDDVPADERLKERVF